jgi:hypothetical protein
MKIRLLKRAEDALDAAPPSVEKAFTKQSRLLATNLRHPSLRAKRLEGTSGRWQARINRDWRFYFVIERDAYVVLDVIPHPK